MPQKLEIDERLRGIAEEYVKRGGFFRNRGKNGKITISIPKIDMPKFTGFEHMHVDGNEQAIWDSLAEQMRGRATRPALKKPKPYRSIEEPWEPAW